MLCTCYHSVGVYVGVETKIRKEIDALCPGKHLKKINMTLERKIIIIIIINYFIYTLKKKRAHRLPFLTQHDATRPHQHRGEISLRLRHGARESPPVNQLVQGPLLRLQPFRGEIGRVQKLPGRSLNLRPHPSLRLGSALALAAGERSRNGCGGKQSRSDRLVRLLAPFYFRDRCLAYACVQVGVGLVRLKARITSVQHGGGGGGTVGRRHPPSPRRSQAQRQNTVEDHVSKKAKVHR